MEMLWRESCEDGYSGFPVTKVFTTEAQSSQSSENFLIKPVYSVPSAPPRCNLRVLLHVKA